MDKAAWTGIAGFSVLLGLALVGPTIKPLHPDGQAPPWSSPLVHRDLERIAEDTLRVLVIRDPLTWEEHPGAESGLEWELISRFARRQKLHRLAIPVTDPDSALAMLQRGKGDVIAAQMAPDGWAKDFAAFSRPYRSVAPLRAVLNSDHVVRPQVRERHRPGEPDTLLVSRWSPFVGRDSLFDPAYGALTLMTDTALPEDLLVKVAMGACSGALVVDAISSLELRRLPHVHFGPRLGRSIPLAFAVRRNAPELLAALNAWLNSPEESEARTLIIASYGSGRLTRGPLRTLHDLEFTTDSISPFDSLFQLHADSSWIDWELLAAVGFKESRFDTTARSKAGAAGLMQIMPKTAAALGVEPDADVGGHIGGARKYLDKLDAMWKPSIPDREQRLKFVLASYNAGPGHIKDAQRIAELHGLDPRRWDGSVERALLLLAKPRWYTRPDVKAGYCRAHETFWFVRDVVAAFRQYRGKRR